MKTVDNLKLSLITLLNEYPLNDISVTKLCKQANIHRSSFYAHYDSTFDLLSEIHRDLMNTIIKFDNYNIEVFFNCLTSHIDTNQALYKCILTSNNYPEKLYIDFVDTLKDILIPHYYDKEEDIDLYSYLLTDTIINLLTYWLEHNEKNRNINNVLNTYYQHTVKLISHN